MKIGLVTWHYYPNYGSALQTFALQETLKDMGNSVEIINYRNPKFGIDNKYKEFVKKIICKLNFSYLKNKLDNFFIFQTTHLRQSKVYYEANLLKNVVNKYDAFVCGSDQIWAPNCFNPVYMLDFVTSDKIKISYAASIGLNYIPDELVPIYKKHLSTFDSVSIREDKGKELLKSRCDINAVTVCDPTLLLSKDKWELLEEKPCNIDSNFVFCYFLNKDNKYKEKVIQFAKEKDLNIIGISAKTDDYNWIKRLENIGPKQFLWLIHNSKYIFTDSYHGTILSIIFHKTFVTFERFSSNDAINQNSRIYQLSSWFDLDKNIFTIDNYDYMDEINCLDYKKIDVKIKELQHNAIKYLENSLR